MAALRDTLPVKLAPETYEKVVNSNFLYEGGFVLAPGKYKLKVVARENESGKIGTFEQQLNLPDATASPFALSSVVVSNQLQDNSATAAASTRRGRRDETPNPLQLGSRSVLPSVTRVFRTNQNLYVYLESYAGHASGASNSKNGASGGTAVQTTTSRSAVPPSVALVFFRGARKISEAGPFAGKWVSAKGGKASYFVQIPLDKFPPGRYLMQVNVLDPSADRVAFAHVPMAIMRAPATPAVRSNGTYRNGAAP
jgi:hypothetical protein